MDIQKRIIKLTQDDIIDLIARSRGVTAIDVHIHPKKCTVCNGPIAYEKIEMEAMVEVPIFDETRAEVERRVLEEMKTNIYTTTTPQPITLESIQELMEKLPKMSNPASVSIDIARGMRAEVPGVMDDWRGNFELNPDAKITDEEAKKRARMTGILGTGESKCRSKE